MYVHACSVLVCPQDDIDYDAICVVRVDSAMCLYNKVICDSVCSLISPSLSHVCLSEIFLAFPGSHSYVKKFQNFPGGGDIAYVDI